MLIGKKLHQCLSVVLSAVMTFSLVQTTVRADETSSRTNSTVKNVNTDISYLQPKGEYWDASKDQIITFGKFGSGGEYDYSHSENGINDGYVQSGTEGEYDTAMTYRVLSFQDGTMLLDNNKRIITLPWEFGGYTMDGKDVKWTESSMREWLNGKEFLENPSVFTPLEKSAILKTSLKGTTEYTYHSDIFRSDYIAKDYESDDNIFLLSMDEVLKHYNNDYHNYAKQWEKYDYYNGRSQGYGNYTWTRTKAYMKGDTGADCYGYIATYGYINRKFGIGMLPHQNQGLSGVSPAFRIDPSKIFYTYESGKDKPSAIKEVSDSDSNTWTLTLKDGNNSFNASTESAKILTGEDLKVKVSSLGTAPESVKYTQLTGFIYNNDKTEALAYGKVSDAKMGEVNVSLPDCVKNTKGKYVLRIFAEDVNSSASNGLTDYSSNYVDIPFEVKTPHHWVYSADKNVVTAQCSDSDCDEYLGQKFTLKLTADDIVYTAKQYDKAMVENKITEVTGETASKIIYVASDGTESDQPPVNAGKYTAKITVGNQTVTADFEIKKADQEIPSVISQDETIIGKQDGIISHVDPSMEISNDGTRYEDITGSQLTGLKPGTYYVRYKEKANYNASKPTKITIKEGKVLTVAVPEDQIGYTLTLDNNKVNWNGNSTLKFELKQGYSKTKDFKILVNGKEIITDENGQYKISNIKEDTNVTVEGVADITVPTGEIKIASDTWKEFINKITFGRFYNESQKVTIGAEDQGSGIYKVFYYISHKEMTKEEVETLKEDQWITYDDPFNIDPDNDYVIYAKIIDKAGNTTYISSDGIILDQVKAVVNGVESGHTYTKTQTFTVDEKHLKEVKVDGKAVTPDENGIYTLIPKEGTYRIEVTDKAGNVTTIENVMVNWEEVNTPEIKAATYNKEDQKADIVETNEYKVTRNDGGVNAGSYDVVLELKDIVNYKWKRQRAGEKQLTETFVIGKKEIGIKWGMATFDYDGAMHVPQATATGIEKADVVKLIVSGSKKNPGSNYTAKVTAVSNPNYKLPVKGITKQFTIKASIKKTEKTANDLAMNMGLKVKQYDNKIKVSYGKIKNASGYEVYVQYCGSDFTKKSLNAVKNGKKTNIVIKKVNGKKLDLKKNYKIYVIAYQKVAGKKIILAKSITAHIVGRKNIAQTNVKAVKVTKTTYQLKAGENAQIKAKTILVDKKKQPLSDNHAKELRYTTSNSKVATVSKTGKIKAVSKGTCDIYVYARNGYAKKIKVTVK